MAALKENCQPKTVKILQKHLEDRYWRLNHLYYILDQQGQKILFEVNPVQYTLYTNLWYLNLIPKARQTGISTFIAIFMLDACLFNENIRCGIVAHKLLDAKKIFRDKVHYAYDNLPDDLKSALPLLKDDSQELVFGNNSGIYVGTSMRSGTLQYLHLCLEGKTGIYTKNAKIKKIEDIVPGDLVLTNKGSYRPVKQLIKNRLKDLGQDLLSLKVFGYYEPLKITSKHKILTREFKTGLPIWKSANELTIKDYIAFPIREPSLRCRHNRIDISGKYIRPDFGLGWLAGFYLAEGTTRKQNKCQSINEVSYAIHEKEVELLTQKIKQYEELFSETTAERIRIYPHKNSKTVVVTVNAKNFSTWLNNTFGQGNEKNIPDKVWNWGHEFLHGLIKGYFDGDGSYKDTRMISATSTRRQILDQLKLLLISLRFGVSTLYYRNAGHYYKRNCKEIWTLILNGPGNWKFRKKHNLTLPSVNTWAGKWRVAHNRNPEGKKFWRRGKNHYWARIQEIKKINPVEYVYDIVLDIEPYNYVTVNGVVHNSEYGWLCTHAPQQAAEVKTGAMETVHKNGMIFIESTAEGPSGDFPDMCHKAEADRISGKKLGPMDWKIHFFSWHEKAANITEPQYVEITEPMQDYFHKVEVRCHKTLTAEQKAWYAAKKKTLGNLIYKEHPSTLDEAFFASVQGSYFGDKFTWLHENGRIGEVPHNPSYLTYIVCDPGYTSAWWLFQVMPTGFVNFLRYYEDTGKDFGYYADILAKWKERYGYRYGTKFAPYDVDNNQYKLVASEGLLEIARKSGIDFTRMETEKNVQSGIARTNVFLESCRFDNEGCQIGIEKAKAYHEVLNLSMSTEDKPVFTGLPAKDGNDHAADGLRYVSMAVPLIQNQDVSGVKTASWKELKRKYS